MLPAIAGRAAGSAAHLDGPVPGLLLAAGGAAAAACAAARWQPKAWAAALVSALFLAGAAESGPGPPAPGRLTSRSVRLTLRIDRVAPPKSARRASGIATLVPPGVPGCAAGERIYFTFLLRRGQAPPLRSAVVAASGVLRAVPRQAAADSFAGYLAGLGLSCQLFPAWIQREVKPPKAYPRFCERLAARMDGLLRRGLEARPDLAAVYRAMMLGRKGDLGAAQKQLFLRSGTMHLFAINGLHIGIVALSLHALLALARCPRRLRSAAVLAVLWLDVDSTGATPSAVRAWIMVAALECAGALDLPANPLAALAFAAGADLCVRPADFLGASFQMSYGVMAALLALGLPLAEFLQARFAAYRFLPAESRTPLQRLRAAAQHHLCGSLGVGVAAALASLVSGVQFFSLIAPCGLAANLLLMPPATLVIVAGFGSVLAGLAGLGPLSVIFNRAAGLLLRVIAALLRLGAAAPGAYFPAHYRAAWIGPAAQLALLAACLAGYAGGWRRERGGWWPPFAVVAAVLLAGVRYR